MIDGADADVEVLPSITASDEEDTVVGSVGPSRSSATPNSVIESLQKLFDQPDAVERAEEGEGGLDESR